MAGTTQICKIHYHFEQGGKKASQDYIDYVSVADTKYETIKTVLNNNSRLQGGTLVIDACMSSPSGSGTILT